jgi:hypothetical protein
MKLLFFSLFFFTLPLNAFYLLPETHPLKEPLAKLFLDPTTLESPEKLFEKGFKPIALKKQGTLFIGTHHTLPGYVVKFYLLPATAHEANSNYHTLLQRCRGAKKIRDLLKEGQSSLFAVPDKWLYELPYSSETYPLYILLATDMQILNLTDSASAWKHKVTKEHLQELLAIIKTGSASFGLTKNVPYTKSGRFAFIDTEYPDRELDLREFTPYFSQEMQRAWKELSL